MLYIISRHEKNNAVEIVFINELQNKFNGFDFLGNKKK